MKNNSIKKWDDFELKEALRLLLKAIKLSQNTFL